jgi:hypothetical protein
MGLRTRVVEAGCDVRRVVVRYSPTLLHSAYLLIGDHGQAEDMLWLTLLRTARHWAAAGRAPEPYARQVRRANPNARAWFCCHGNTSAVEYLRADAEQGASHRV